MRRRFICHNILPLFSLLILLAGRGGDGWNIGEEIPVTLHMRLQREGMHANTVGEDVKGTDNMQEHARTTHFSRPLPPDVCPRFGINMRVHQPAKQLHEYARNTLKHSGRSLSDVAIRFQLERGLTKATAWFPLLRGTRQTVPLHLRKHNGTSYDEKRIFYLTAINFNFGYQQGTFNKPTTFRAEPVYTVARHDVIELRYHWEEYRAYNPHRAISTCAFVSVITTVVVLYVIIFSNGPLSEKIRKKQIILRNHKE